MAPLASTKARLVSLPEAVQLWFLPDGLVTDRSATPNLGSVRGERCLVLANVDVNASPYVSAVCMEARRKMQRPTNRPDLG
jgi:hypothetical protein